MKSNVILWKNKTTKRNLLHIPTINKQLMTETLHTPSKIQEWKQSMINYHNSTKLQEWKQLMIHTITFNLAWINDMENGRLGSDCDQVRDQIIIKYPKTAGRGNLIILMRHKQASKKTRIICTPTCIPTYAGIKYEYVWHITITI